MGGVTKKNLSDPSLTFSRVGVGFFGFYWDFPFFFWV